MKKSKFTGRIVQVIGPVVDMKFDEVLPQIKNAVIIDPDNKNLVAEVQQHLEGGLVRTLVLGPAEGLKRGLPVVNTKAPIMVPTGSETLGRVFNVLGQPVDKKGKVSAKEYLPIHRGAPALVEQRTTPEIFET